MTNSVDALRSIPQRTRVHDTAINLKIPGEVKDRLEQVAKDQEVSMSTIIRWALADYLEK
ncbi:ribbon-helix-helix protein, CopG family [Streptomyces sp. NBC_00525]|uniref:ribbon-helix-helix protein, CopG family n=1 Tax=Streptomyces sp. NBC_00525 TaxID=2903660 RepID=UPI002E7FE70F|nr:ribbon-helix-helix protein, CopG family [Streptomyces sp. NBC_00525]WUC97406.1 ribbon-helix-helix protein, CopG family [Streptomyces sp. NBC_00525]